MTTLFPPALTQKAENLLIALRSRNLTLATAESCTGGLVAGLLTEIPGASDMFTHGFVTYANAAKEAMVGVRAALIKTHGAVSEEVARAMAEGAQAKAGSSMALAVTGIAGPGGATKDKPVGLVHIAAARAGHATLHRAFRFSGDRTTVRLQAVEAALELVQYQLNA
jgi:nicotinamide-nucleotide amidase